jgi:hypothetical protein
MTLRRTFRPISKNDAGIHPCELGKLKVAPDCLFLDVEIVLRDQGFDCLVNAKQSKVFTDALTTSCTPLFSSQRRSGSGGKV